MPHWWCHLWHFGLFILLPYFPPETGQASCCQCFDAISLDPCRRVCWVRYPNWICACVSYSPDLKGLPEPCVLGIISAWSRLQLAWSPAGFELFLRGSVRCNRSMLPVTPGSGNTVGRSLSCFFTEATLVRQNLWSLAVREGACIVSRPGAVLQEAFVQWWASGNNYAGCMVVLHLWHR